MGYIIRDNTTSKSKVYYYSIINNKVSIVTTKSQASIFNKEVSAKNTLINNIPKYLSTQYKFEVASYDDIKIQRPISKTGKITYTYNLNIPDAPILNKTNNKNENNNILKSSKPIRTMLFDHEKNHRQKELYDKLDHIFSNIQVETNDLIKYKEMISQEISHCDKEIVDITHFIEFNTLNACDGYVIYRDLHNLLNQRRELKNLLKIINDFCDNVSTLKNVVFQKRIIDYMSNNNAHYNPRTKECMHLFS